jgi:hypothetical protein
MASGRRPGPKPRRKKPESKRTYSRNSAFAIQDSADCARCGLKIWAHNRCTECRAFVWCTDVDMKSLVHKHRDCSKVVK